MTMKKELYNIADQIYEAVLPHIGDQTIEGTGPDGDPQWRIDDIAERATTSALEQLGKKGYKVALFSEDSGGVVKFDKNPDYLFIVDPVDGSRPAKNRLPMWSVCIAVAPYSENPTVGDVSHSIIKTSEGIIHYAERGKGAIIQDPRGGNVENRPKLLPNTELEGTPLMYEVCGTHQGISGLIHAPLLDATALKGGAFTVSSSSWAMAQLVQGNIGVYTELTKKVYDEFPSYQASMKEQTGGHLKALFSYDIAPWWLLARESGIILTDASGRSLDDMVLTDIRAENQRSALAACTPQLHAEVLEKINDRITYLKDHRDEVDIVARISQ